MYNFLMSSYFLHIGFLSSGIDSESLNRTVISPFLSISETVYCGSGRALPDLDPDPDPNFETVRTRINLQI
jgi:hypothetical protein